MTLEEAEKQAYDYLKFTNGKVIADWARLEKNGTWETTLAMFTGKDISGDHSEETPA